MRARRPVSTRTTGPETTSASRRRKLWLAAGRAWPATVQTILWPAPLGCAGAAIALSVLGHVMRESNATGPLDPGTVRVALVLAALMAVSLFDDPARAVVAATPTGWGRTALVRASIGVVVFAPVVLVVLAIGGVLTGSSPVVVEHDLDVGRYLLEAGAWLSLAMAFALAATRWIGRRGGHLAAGALLLCAAVPMFTHAAGAWGPPTMQDRGAVMAWALTLGVGVLATVTIPLTEGPGWPRVGRWVGRQDGPRR